MQSGVAITFFMSDCHIEVLYTLIAGLFHTVKPLLSGHPRGMAGWPLKTGSTKQSNAIKNDNFRVNGCMKK